MPPASVANLAQREDVPIAAHVMRFGHIANAVQLPLRPFGIGQNWTRRCGCYRRAATQILGAHSFDAGAVGTIGARVEGNAAWNHACAPWLKKQWTDSCYDGTPVA
jgi:hypothetical protein